MRSSALAAAALFLASALTGGCRVFDEELLPVDGGVDAGEIDAGDAGGDDTGTADAGCIPHKPPARPTAMDPMDGEELAFALRDILFQPGPMWASIGYDLDDLCSYAPPRTDGGMELPPLECVPPNPGASPETDGRDGIDNSFGENFPILIFTFVGDMMADVQELFDRELMAGRGLVVIRIRGWNGMDDDPRVGVTVANAVRTVPASAADGGTPDGGTPMPAWDGTDVFLLASDDFVGGDETRPRIQNDNGYVAERTLVVELPDRSEFVWTGDGLVFPLVLTDPRLTGRISDDGLTLEDVTITGRWAELDLLEGFEGLTFCAGTGPREALERLFDDAADVRQDSTTGGMGVECDAVSVGIRMTGYRGEWGALASPEPAPETCP